MDVEKELLEACIKQERRAQFELYKRCYSILMSVCMRYERNKEDAEFMLNQVFHKILTHLDRYDDKAPFEAWIRRIAINTQIDEFRKNSRSKLDYYEQPMDMAPLTVMDYNEADKKFDAEELETMIRMLPPVSQKVFNLYVIDGYNHKEIADQLDMSEGTSKWHLSSARKKLKAMMKKILNNVAVLL
ncbi:RNA polymerase sigma factor, sigma-70 family [Owenweeksia hongkongensis DSM 17368]|uniref:RNA polymerase sigma factor, sigma-70 family n=1 Tax=Owenweeksia hongkongensis (strain DSM 17368 / CIP 108786 / JCM 12287 / NRRL B-23963 / UST20020801) TaxID=926562 RepID=G8R700_OWEHD|nr:RNA polymerase sigma factor [Owenweeksia hongkongensis]AEV33365.1 RNA polymerase sigma factor, sigma-70 family [Owenweeksia hongkongensis DSM 17368]